MMCRQWNSLYRFLFLNPIPLVILQISLSFHELVTLVPDEVDSRMVCYPAPYAPLDLFTAFQLNRKGANNVGGFKISLPI